MPETFQLPSGETVLVDEEDYDRVIGHKWAAIRSSRTIYAATHLPSVGGKQPSISLHRFILGAPPGMEVDHRDGNGLNNKRSNIRIVTKTENQRAFRRKTIGASSKYRGVVFARRKPHHEGRWHGFLVYSEGGKRIQKYLGSYKKEIDAATAFNNAAAAVGYLPEGLNIIPS